MLIQAQPGCLSMGDDQWALMWVRVPKSCPSGSTSYLCPPGCGESPAAGEPPKTGMGRDGRGLSSLSWVKSLSRPQWLTSQRTQHSEPEVMGRGDGDVSATGAPTGASLLYSEAARGKRLSPSQMAAMCHPSTLYHLPKAGCSAEGCRGQASPRSNSSHTKRVQGLAQASSSFGETPNPFSTD